MNEDRIPNGATGARDEFHGTGNTPYAASGNATAPAESSTQPLRAGQRGGATSALTRDAARLRSVMVHAVEGGRTADPLDEHDAIPYVDTAVEFSNADAQHHAELARTAGMPSLPDLGEACVPSGVELGTIGIDTVVDELPGGDVRRPTSLRTPARIGTPVRSVMADRTPLAASPKSEPTGGGTRLKSIDVLRSKSVTSQTQREPIAVAPIAPTSRPQPDETVVDHYEQPVFTEIERKDSYTYGTADQPADTYREPVYAQTQPEPIHISIDEPMNYSRSRVRQRGDGGRKAITIAMVLVGTAIGVGLYAGGGDLLSSIFSNKKEGVSIVSPSTVTERPAMPPTTGAVTMAAQGMPQDMTPPAPAVANNDAQGEVSIGQNSGAVQPDREAATHTVANAPGDAGSAQNIAAAHHAPMVVDIAEQKQPDMPKAHMPKHDSVATTQKGVAAKPAAKPLTASAAKGAKDDKTAADKQKAALQADKSKGAAKDAGGNYMVQVRATPDEAEAKLIAKRLRGKGANSVSIVPSKGKDGTTLYRVRYNAKGTSGDAQQAATRAGYKDVWVVKQK